MSLDWRLDILQQGVAAGWCSAQIGLVAATDEWGPLLFVLEPMHKFTAWNV